MIEKILKKICKIIYKLIILGLIVLLVFGIVQRTSDNRNSIFGIKIFTVITGSMIPVYNIGDIIIVKEVEPKEIKVDDDIVYKGEKGTFRDKVVTHRVLSIEKEESGNYKIITKGVANRAKDPEINQTQVLGKVIGKISIVNYILKIVTNIYVLIMIPIAIFIYKNIQRIKNYENE